MRVFSYNKQIVTLGNISISLTRNLSLFVAIKLNVQFKEHAYQTYSRR